MIAEPATSPTQGSEATRDLVNLDLLRAVAVGIVFFGHMMGIMRVRGLGDVGHFGVLLFFVHTSLVLMFSMERLGLSGGRLYTAFMVRRIFRIYPLSVLIVLLVVAFRVPSVPWLGGFVWPGWLELSSNLLLTQNITHSGSVNCVLWSLPFEVQMYAALPLLYFLTCRFPSPRAAMVIWLTGVAVAGLEYFVRSGKCDLEFLLLRYVPCFLAGVVAWRLFEVRRRMLPGMLWVLVLLVLVTFYRLHDVIRVYGPNWQASLHGVLRSDHRVWWPPYMDLISDWVFCGIAGLLVPLFAGNTSRLVNAITRRIALYSYGVYVSHVPILWLCFARLHLGNAFASVILTVVLTALVSFALYHCIEHPAIRLGKQLSLRLVSRIAPTRGLRFECQ